MNLSIISDSNLQSEYIKRFTLSSGERIGSADDVILHLRPFFTDPFREQFVVIFLNGKNAVITTEVLFEGTLTTSAVYPRELIRKILDYGAAALVIAHNHPSANPEPSKDDIFITKKLKDACVAIDAVIHDHLIIAGTTYTSFADRGLI